MKCTWVDCPDEALVPQIAKDGEQWATLCARHASEIDVSIDTANARKLLGDWVRAMGGAEAAARRMIR